MPHNDIILFISTWEKFYGTKIVDRYPPETGIDLETASTQIFINYQYFHESDSDSIKELAFTLPFKNLKKIARIYINNREEKKDNDVREKFYIITILLPDYFPSDRIEKFDKIITEIKINFLQENKGYIKDYYQEISRLFRHDQMVSDAEITIEEDYSFQDALKHFKAGLVEYKKKNYSRAYFLLRKSELKFEKEKDVRLLLECEYYLGILLAEQKKFDAASTHLEKLVILSSQMNNIKYSEISRFILSQNHYKMGEYEVALKHFKKLENIELQHINQFEFFHLGGRILASLGKYEEAKDLFIKALNYSEIFETQEIRDKKVAKAYLQLGLNEYRSVYHLMEVSRHKKQEIERKLKDTIEYFSKAENLFKNLKFMEKIIQINQLLGAIFEILDETEKSIQAYEKGLNYSDLSNDITSKFIIFRKLVEIYRQNDQPFELIKRIDILLHELAPIAYLDLFTIAQFHSLLGKTLLSVGQYKEALSENVVALNIYDKIEKPSIEKVKCIETIIEIYKEMEKVDYVDYYSKKLYQIKELMKLEEEKGRAKYKILDLIKEFWIFSSEGQEIFSYTYATELNPQLMSGFLLAMNNFGSDLNLDQIRAINIAENIFTYYQNEKHPFFIVGRSDKNQKISILEKGLHKILEEFAPYYQPDLEEQSVESNLYEELKNHLPNVIIYK